MNVNTHYKYVIVEGVIGAGKTTLAKMLAQDLSGKLILEEFVTNSFLEKFYTDPERYAFPVEVGFLAERFRQLEAESGADLFTSFNISDYHFGKTNIFARINLSADHYQIFRSLYEIFIERVPKPDIILYLDNTVGGLVNNIKKRSRTMESTIPNDYLEKLQKGYSEFLLSQKEVPIVVIDMDGQDFVADDKCYQKIKEALSIDYPTGITELRL